MMGSRWHASALVLLVLSCGPGLVPSGETSDASGSSSTAPGATSAGPTSGSADEGTTIQPPTTASSGMLEPTGTTTGDGTTAAECDPTAPLGCDDDIWSCGDGMDNDGDGLVDLQDPECLSPCDDSENNFPWDYPADHWDCSTDCGFDANDGEGDDQCSWNLSCDPLAPATETKANCIYDPQSTLCDGQPEIPEACVDFCQPLVPNGCDCFGCCTVATDAGPIDVWLAGLGAASGSSECATTNLLACPPCTSHMELCGNPCEPEACEICVGQLEPPPGCEAAGCVGGTPCEDDCDCEPGEHCVTGCCHPTPPG